MTSIQGFLREKSDSIAVFCKDAELSLNDFSKDCDFTYYKLFSSKVYLGMLDSSKVISSFKYGNTSQIRSKQQALKDLVEAAAAPYLEQENDA